MFSSRTMTAQIDAKDSLAVPRSPFASFDGRIVETAILLLPFTLNNVL